jgi:hypothetical protein
MPSKVNCPRCGTEHLDGGSGGVWCPEIATGIEHNLARCADVLAAKWKRENERADFATRGQVAMSDELQARRTSMPLLEARCKALEAERDEARRVLLRCRLLEDIEDEGVVATVLAERIKNDVLTRRLAELESVPTRTDHEIYADAKRIKALEVERSRLDEKWREYETHYILPLFDRATKMGFDLQQMVHDNPGKNCSMLFADVLTCRVVELESWVGRLRQELSRFKGDPLVDIALEDTVSQAPRKEGT